MTEDEKAGLFNIHFSDQIDAMIRDFVPVISKIYSALRKNNKMNPIHATLFTCATLPMFFDHMFGVPHSGAVEFEAEDSEEEE